MTNPYRTPGEVEPSTKFLPFDVDTLSRLDDAHGDIRIVTGAKPPAKSFKPDFKPEHPWQAVFCKPTVGESDNFEGAAHNDRAKPGALRNLAKAIVVGVSLDGKQTFCIDRNDRASVKQVRDAWETLRAKYPGAHMAAQDDLMSLASMSADESGKE